MREEWFTAVSFEAAISVAQEAFYGGEGYALIGIPVDLDSVEGRRLSPRSSAPTKGRAAVRAKGHRM